MVALIRAAFQPVPVPYDINSARNTQHIMCLRFADASLILNLLLGYINYLARFDMLQNGEDPSGLAI